MLLTQRKQPVSWDGMHQPDAINSCPAPCGAAMTTIKMHNIDVKDREAKPMRNLEAIMLHEQKLAAAEEEVAGESAQQEQAALAAAAIDLAMPAAGPPDTADIVEQLEAGSAEAGSAIDMDDAMQLCSAAELEKDTRLPHTKGRAAILDDHVGPRSRTTCCILQAGKTACSASKPFADVLGSRLSSPSSELIRSSVRLDDLSGVPHSGTCPMDVVVRQAYWLSSLISWLSAFLCWLVITLPNLRASSEDCELACKVVV
ncbi:hypothetical protein WJX77_010381 [Trebouxia sp. C0004]